MKPAPRLGAIFLTVFLDLLGFGLVLPFLAEGGARHLRRQRVRRDAPRLGLLADAVPLRPGVGARLGPRRAAPGPPLVHRRHRARDGRARARRSRAGSSIALALRRAHLRRHRHGEPRHGERVHRRHHEARGPRARAWGSSAWRSASASSSARASAARSPKIAIDGRHGAVPCFVAAGLSVVNLVWVALGVAESLAAREARATAPRRKLAPLNVDAMRERVRAPRRRRSRVAVNFLVILSFTNLDQTFTFFCGDVFGIDERGTGLRARLHRHRRGGGAGRPRAPAREALRRGDRSCAPGRSSRRSRSRGSWPPARSGRARCSTRPARCSPLGNGLTQPTTSAFISRRAPRRPPGRHARHQPVVREPGAHLRPRARAAGSTPTSARARPYAAASLGMVLALALAMGLRKSTGDAER